MGPRRLRGGGDAAFRLPLDRAEGRRRRRSGQGHDLLFGGQAQAWSAVLQVVSVATMFWGNLAAMTQKSVKRMLAYSAIAQAGYVAIGLAAWGETGRTAVLFYLAVYVVMNAAAFGLILLVDGGRGFDETVDGLRGLVRRAPVAAASVLVVLLALAGIPPTAGFMGKYFLFDAAVGQGLVPLAAAGALNSVLSLFYYFRVGRAIFLEEALPARRRPPGACPRWSPSSWPSRRPPCSCWAFCRIF
ncbi:MAG: hypothetical protein MZV64_63600 [Ignavibacteriales bacterium]|nr:hypothetical protein [Ignavibacteriales bacterium]